MSQCPQCGTEGVYNSGISIECPSRNCSFFSQKQLDAVGPPGSNTDQPYGCEVIRIDDLDSIHLENLSRQILRVTVTGKRPGTAEFSMHNSMLPGNNVPYYPSGMKDYDYYEVIFASDRKATVQVEKNKYSGIYTKNFITINSGQPLVLTYGKR